MEPVKRRDIRTAVSITKWIVGYLVAVLLMFGFSFLYFSSPDLFAFTLPSAKKNIVVSQPVPFQTPPTRSESSLLSLKNSYNQLTIGIQKTSGLFDESRKVNVAGDSKRTAANYRAIQQSCDSLLAQFTISPEVLPEVGAVLMPLKESLSLLSKSTSIMADYLEGKLSLAPPNPDWVGRSQEYSAQSFARIKEAQQALSNLRKKIE